MKVLLLLSFLSSFSVFASTPLDEVVCFSDMTDGHCEMKEIDNRYQVTCSLSVILALKNGEKVNETYEGISSVKKPQYALMMNSIMMDRAVLEANSNLLVQIQPFYSMETCR